MQSSHVSPVQRIVRDQQDAGAFGFQGQASTGLRTITAKYIGAIAEFHAASFVSLLRIMLS